MPRPLLAIATVFIAVLTLAAAPHVRAQTNGTPERYTALAVNMSGRGGAAAGTIEIVVNRWSTDAERDKLMNVLMDQGADKLLDVLQSMPRVGYFRSLN